MGTMRVGMVSVGVLTVMAGGLVGCADRPFPSGAPSPSGSGSTGGTTGGAGGAAGARGTDTENGPALCPSLANGRPGGLALLGRDGNRAAFIGNDGRVRSGDTTATPFGTIEQNGWIGVYGFADATRWWAKLFDPAGVLRNDASGALPATVTGTGPAGLRGATMLPDGTVVVHLASSSGDVVLTSDGHVLIRPSFSTAPDARGWVAATLASDTAVLGVPVMLNVPSGEVRNLTYRAPDDAWAPVVDGARRLYLADKDGAVVLVDESPDAIHVEPLTGWSRDVLQVQTVHLSNGRGAAYVGLWDDTRQGVPLWLYDVDGRRLVPALPEAAAETNISGGVRGDDLIVWLAGMRAWQLDLASRVVFDFRVPGTLTVRSLLPPPGGPPDWVLLPDNAKNLYRYDRSAGTLEDLHLAGDAIAAGSSTLVWGDGRPRAWVDVGAGAVQTAVRTIQGGDAPGVATTANFDGAHAVVGLARRADGPFAPIVPLWRVDNTTLKAEPFPAIEPALALVEGGVSPSFRGLNAIPVVSGGGVGLVLSDGLGDGLYLATPGVPWMHLGRSAREIEWMGWAAGPAGITIATERNCGCYDPIGGPWAPAPTGAAETVTGVSLQFLAADGSDLFSPVANEHLVSFSDGSNTCALTRSDAGDWAVYDLGARTRRALGHYDLLSWAPDAP